MQRARTEARGDTALVLVAAGDSSRMGLVDGARKPFADLLGRTMIERAAEAFASSERVAEIVVVAQLEDHARVIELAQSGGPLARLTAVVAGGKRRADSVLAGVEATSPERTLVAVHDAARPLIDAETVARALDAAAEQGAALVAERVVDTIKRSTDGARAEETLDRNELWAAQTPQVFRREELCAWFARADEEGFSPTDDAALCERYRGPVPIVEGTPTNFKLTTPHDLELARALLAQREQGAEAS